MSRRSVCGKSGHGQYLSNIDPLFSEDVKVLRDNPTSYVDVSVQHDDEKKRGALLYSLLASLVKQRPLMVVRSVHNNNGLEAYRQLLLSNEPVNKNRALSLLNVIMNWPQFNGKSSFLSQVLRLENAFYEYDKLGTKLAEELRTAVLLRSVTGRLKVWLQLQIDDSYGYDKVRELILSYERSTARWTEQMVLGSSMTSTDTGGPMEVDRIQKGKGDGKAQQKGNGKKGDGKGTYGGKGKSKFDQKGKGKFSYGDKGKGKGKHSKSGDFKGHDSKGHGKWHDYSKGKGHGQSKGRGDGGKGGQSAIQCWHCGGNHKAANCWKNNHVRQVFDGQDSQQQQQSSNPPSQSQSSQSQQANSSAPASSAATTYRVNRVSAYNDTESVFDLCGSDVDFSNMRVCAVKSDLSNCSVETFCIHSDSDFDDFGTLDMSASLEDIRHVYSESTDWTTPCNTVDVTSTWLGGYDIVQSSSICLRDDRPWRPKPISSSCHSESPTCFDGSHLTRQPCHVGALSFQDGNQVTEILVDSGSDATVVPLAFADCGREFSFVLQSSCGRTIRFKEVGHVSQSLVQSYPMADCFVVVGE